MSQLRLNSSARPLRPGAAPANLRPPRQHYKYQDYALGLVSTVSFPAIVGTADMMLKSADVKLVGYEKIGAGHCTAIVRGRYPDVQLAVQEGARTAEQFGQFVSQLVIPRPMPNLEVVFPLGSRLMDLVDEPRSSSRLSNRAIGLLETRGFPAMVGAADTMLKSADVQLASYETIGDGLCTAIVRGTVANVAVAIEAGMHEAERIGELHAVMVIPRLLDDLESIVPVASYWLDPAEEPLPNLATISTEAAAERQPLELPEVEREALPAELEEEAIPVEVEVEARPSIQRADDPTELF
ncbi:MAG: BMC domain-containing protein [Geitlerinemataceae cyanobacterium]